MSGDPPPETSTSPAPARDPELEAQIAETVIGFPPHNRALGLRFLSSDRGRLTVVLPYDAKLVGNPLTRVIHGGAITALMDATCGAAVFLSLGEPVPVATLDLRIDYLKPAKPDLEVHATAECFKMTQNVAFVRCEAYHPGTERDLVAVANGTFMIFRSQSLLGKRKKKTG